MGIRTKIGNSINLLQNMGWRYTKFRLKHELEKRSGILKKRFPVAPPYQQFYNLDQWKQQNTNFFFADKESLNFPKNPSDSLKHWFEDFQAGKLLHFNSVVFDLGKDYDWITNPDTGFRYDINKHWTDIADLSKDAGDIKFVWEKSRFSFLYYLIRYDYHFDQDCAEIVFAEILSWIRQNPVNQGPNYRCSQEISLRVLNWTFALYYYKNSPALTKEVFDQIQFAIYWQMDHVYKNIDFSRIAVRNNHAITETLALYLIGLLYPLFPNASTWKTKGKAWFEEEIEYQVYEDGTFLQFSMNYHRVVIQLFTWAFAIAEKNGETYKPVVYQRAKKSLEFLRICMNDADGWLPNYGSNDGALFFPLNDCHFRDYRPQLQALVDILKENCNFGVVYEDVYWYGIKPSAIVKSKIPEGIFEFNAGGFYIIREEDSLTFIRCGKHRDRPAQADNLHMDIWYKGENIIADGGSYKYNTDTKNLQYFMGTASHNTVMLNGQDQMQKGSRFIWYHWSQAVFARLSETNEQYLFSGVVSAFRHIDAKIRHKREIIKIKGKPEWIIKDTILNKPSTACTQQLWHLPLHHTPVQWVAKDATGKALEIKEREGSFSNVYGQKEPGEFILFQTESPVIHTDLKIQS